MQRRQFLQQSSAAALLAANPAAAQATAVSTRFPKGFLWGASTSAHQVEGGNVNSDIWVLEQLKPSPFAEPSGDACDHFQRFRADIAMLAGFGLNTYRFSIEWARIEPEQGLYSHAMLDHYRRMLAACYEHHVTPVVTYHHFTSPRWLAARGGWMQPEAAEHFARYCDKATRALGDMMGYACTINEPNQPIIGHILRGGQQVAGVDRVLAAAAQALGSDRFSAYNFGDHVKIRDVMIDGHRRGFEAIKAAAPHLSVGITLALADMQPVPGGEALYRRIFDESHGLFYAAASGNDFIGVQNYSRRRIGATDALGPEPGLRLDQMNLEYWPQGLEAVIREASHHTGIPVLVTENGLATKDDRQRVVYINQVLAGVRRCIADGIPVKGYIHWSLMDNFEWQMGYYPRYGLVAVDRDTFERTPKPSAGHLGRIARSNGAILSA